MQGEGLVRILWPIEGRTQHIPTLRKAYFEVRHAKGGHVVTIGRCPICCRGTIKEKRSLRGIIQIRRSLINLDRVNKQRCAIRHLHLEVVPPLIAEIEVVAITHDPLKFLALAPAKRECILFDNRRRINGTCVIGTRDRRRLGQVVGGPTKTERHGPLARQHTQTATCTFAPEGGRIHRNGATCIDLCCGVVPLILILLIILNGLVEVKTAEQSLLIFVIRILNQARIINQIRQGSLELFFLQRNVFAILFRRVKEVVIFDTTRSTRNVLRVPCRNLVKIDLTCHRAIQQGQTVDIVFQFN